MPLFTTAAMCVVVSVGSNGQVEFEEGIHQLWPACRIDIWDGTLVGSRSKLRRAIPQYAHFHPENFRPTSWQTYQPTRNMTWQQPHISTTQATMLKIDCEGCEWSSLVPWLDHVCTSQLLLELHVPHPRMDVDFARLMLRVNAEFALFAGEGTVDCGYRATTTRVCVELSLVRRKPCP